MAAIQKAYPEQYDVEIEYLDMIHVDGLHSCCLKAIVNNMPHIAMINNKEQLYARLQTLLSIIGRALLT